MLFKASQFVVICHSSNRKLIHHLRFILHISARLIFVKPSFVNIPSLLCVRGTDTRKQEFLSPGGLYYVGENTETSKNVNKSQGYFMSMQKMLWVHRRVTTCMVFWNPQSRFCIVSLIIWREIRGKTSAVD